MGCWPTGIIIMPEFLYYEMKAIFHKIFDFFECTAFSPSLSSSLVIAAYFTKSQHLTYDHVINVQGLLVVIFFKQR